MFLFIRDCCFGPKSHGRCFCPIGDDFSDFTVLAEATGESVQDVTLFFFFSYCELSILFCERGTVVLAQPQNMLLCFESDFF